MSNLSKEMIQTIKEQTQLVLDGQSKIFDPATIKAQTSFTPTVVYPMPIDTAKMISKNFIDKLTPSLKLKIYFQPADSLHFTINWYSNEQISKVSPKTFIDLLEDNLDFNKISCTVFSPVVGHIGLYVSLDEAGQKIIQSNRKTVFEEWSKFGIKPAFPPDGHIPYAYLARYTAPLSQDDKEFLKELKYEPYQINLDTILFLAGDKFLSLKSRNIYKSWQLK